jgi:hypothetical protein
MQKNIVRCQNIQGENWTSCRSKMTSLPGLTSLAGSFSQDVILVWMQQLAINPSLHSIHPAVTYQARMHSQDSCANHCTGPAVDQGQVLAQLLACRYCNCQECKACDC